MAVAIDDLLHGGGPQHQKKMEAIKEKYKLGKFQFGEGRFTANNIKTLSDGSIYVDQKHYAEEKLVLIPLFKGRKMQRYSFCDDQEIGLLRSLVGAPAWLAKETRPDLCADEYCYCNNPSRNRGSRTSSKPTSWPPKHFGIRQGPNFSYSNGEITGEHGDRCVMEPCERGAGHREQHPGLLGRARTDVDPAPSTTSTSTIPSRNERKWTRSTRSTTCPGNPTTEGWSYGSSEGPMEQGWYNPDQRQWHMGWPDDLLQELGPSQGGRDRGHLLAEPAVEQPGRLFDHLPRPGLAVRTVLHGHGRELEELQAQEEGGQHACSGVPITDRGRGELPLASVLAHGGEERLQFQAGLGSSACQISVPGHN